MSTNSQIDLYKTSSASPPTADKTIEPPTLQTSPPVTPPELSDIPDAIEFDTVVLPLKEWPNGLLKPNPFKKQLGVELDRDRINELRDSVEASGFWSNTVECRKVKNHYELVYGHHRIEAAKRELGGNTTVEIPIRDNSNAKMLQKMVLENANAHSESVAAQVAIVRTVRFELIKHGSKPDSDGAVWCPEHDPKIDGDTVPRNRNVKLDKLGRVNEGRPHEHGSQACIAKYLSNRDLYSETAVHRYLVELSNLDPDILKQLIRADRADTHPERTENVTGWGVKAGIELGRLEDKNTQKAVKRVFDSETEKARKAGRQFHVKATYVKEVADAVAKVPEPNKHVVAVETAKKIVQQQEVIAKYPVKSMRNSALHGLTLEAAALLWLRLMPLSVAAKAQKLMQQHYHPDRYQGNQDTAADVNELWTVLEKSFFQEKDVTYAGYPV